MSYFPLIDFVIADGPISYQAELDCSVNQTKWLLEEHNDIETEINVKKATARAALIDKYNIEEV